MKTNTMVFVKLTKLLFILSFLFSISVYSQYTWNTVPVGGGGFIPRFHFAKTQNVWYNQTDVGGGNRWNETTGRWEQMFSWVDILEWNLGGVESFAVDPNDVTGKTVYACIGQYAYSNSQKGEVVKSTDGGVTWQRFGDQVSSASNWSQYNQFRLVVDPFNKDIIWHGSREGLRISYDGAQTWTKPASAPNGCTNKVVFTERTGAGVMSVSIDESAGSVTGPTRAKTIYVSACDNGFFKSVNGGTSWTKINNDVPGKVRVTSTGMVYYIYLGVLKKYNGSSVVSINPPNCSNVATIAVDPFNENHLMVFEYANTGADAYQSLNSGSTWTKINLTFDFKNTWFQHDLPAAGTYNVSHIEFDPFVQNRVYYSDWQAIYRIDDITKTTVLAYPYIYGHEEGVGSASLTSLPTNSSGVFMLSGFGDIRGIAHKSLSVYPSYRLEPKTVSGCDFAENNTQIMALAKVDGNWTSSTPPHFWLSTNGGNTFTDVKAVGATGGTGRIAVSADGNIFVYGTNNGAYYSTNQGQTWSACSGTAGLEIAPSQIWWVYRSIMSDRKNNNKFYIYINGNVYVSTDGGKTFSKKSTIVLGGKAGAKAWDYSVDLVPSFTTEGELWANAGTNGLYYSTNSGTSFSKISNVQECFAIGIGKGPNATTPSVYILGKVSGVLGYYRSDDRCATWIYLNATGPNLNTCTSITGDRNIYGRMYTAIRGMGIWFCTPVGTEEPLVSAKGQTYIKKGNVFFNPSAGVYVDSVMVSLSTDTIGVTIRYTTNGSDPISSSNVFSASIKVKENTTIKARTFIGSSVYGTISTSAYTINTNKVIIDTLVVANVSASNIPVIDGIMDAIWNTVPADTLKNVTLGIVRSMSDLTAIVKSMWTTDNLYFLVEVNDDTLRNNNAKSFLNDGVELYFDGNNSKTPSYDTFDFSYRFQWNDTVVIENQRNAIKGVRLRQQNTSDGYLMEISIPWSTLRDTAVAGNVFGVDVQVIDNDNTTRDAKIAWYSLSDDAWEDLSIIGRAKLSSLAVKNNYDLEIPKSSVIPNIDGTIESLWNSISDNLTANIISGVVTDNNDLSSKWKVMWDASKLYFVVDVTDDLKYNDSGIDVSKDDGIELYIDADNSKVTTYGANDYQFKFRWNDAVVYESKHNAITGVLLAQTNKTNGYIMEISIPWSTIGIVPSDNNFIGIELQVNDDDNGAGRDGKKAWYSVNDAAWQNPSVFGTGKLMPLKVVTSYDAIAEKTSSSIIIDGNAESTWNIANSYSVSNTITGVVNNSNDLSGTWKALWDNTYLYVFADIIDDVKINDSGVDVYKDDAVEVYIDADNSKATTFGTNDFQYQFRFNDSTIYELKHAATAGVQFAQTSGTNGYKIEVAIPWSVLNVIPLKDNLIGFELQVNDDDDGLVRDGKIAWKGITDQAWTNPSVFGVVLLKDNIVTSLYNKINSDIIEIYPTVTNSLVYINSEVLPHNIIVYNSNGIIVKQYANISKINVSDLTEGVYLVRIETTSKTVIKKFIKK